MDQTGTTKQMEIAMTSTIIDAIKDGSFPDSEEVLSSEINQANIPPLLSAIDSARSELSQTVRTVSRQEAGDVDGWIEQAKRVQADIARCKEDARHIVQEHQRIEALRAARDEARNKSRLLETEISFNGALEKQILLISDISIALSKVDQDIAKQQLFVAAQTLPDLTASINQIPSDQSRALLSRIQFGLEQRLTDGLKRDLDKHVLISATDSSLRLQILQDLPQQRLSPELDAAHVQQSNLSLNQILESIQSLGLLDDVTVQLSRRIETAVLPHLYKRAKLIIASAERTHDAISVELSSDSFFSVSTISAVFQVARYLHDHCPTNIRDQLMHNTLSRLVPVLVSEWLNPAIPTELDQLEDLSELRNVVTDFDSWSRERGYGETVDLESWVRDMPKTWLSKRRTLSLDAVRKAFKLAAGSMRLVERVERQTMDIKEPQAGATEDDWASNWDDDDDQNDITNSRKIDDTGDDGSDAWGFGAEDQDNDTSEPSITAAPGDNDKDEDGDAWGWGDDDDSKGNAPASKSPIATKPNGVQSSRVEPRDVVLKESYYVTDIPEYIIEQIGIDMADDRRLHESPSSYFKTSSAPPAGLGSLPTLTLAMFRAIATTAYQSGFSPPLSNMHIYNDTLYLASKLVDSSHDPNIASPQPYSNLRSEVPVLEKFARQTYTSELSVHRTVLLDLLDNAQGFVSCTRSPYSEACETAIASATNHLRSLHSQWSHILSTSHLCQSIGSLLNSIMRKIIEDIEDMEDISEPESRKLVSLCEPVSALQSLFVVESPTSESTGQQSRGEGPVSTVALHCTSYLRFQYLLQILESNLVEIRYLWTDAGLSLEFRPEEVVDLIEALFSESQQRRSAINVIKSGA